MTSRPSPNGYALVLVLWLVTLLTIVTAGFRAAVQTETPLLAHATYGARAEAAAEAGLWLAVRQLAANRSARHVANRQRLSFGEAEIAVSMAGVSSQVNLNRAGRELLAVVLASTDLPPVKQSGLVDAMLDWRDPDHDPLPNGAEDADYAAAGADHGARDGPFATVDELRHVAGMTDDVYRRIAPLLTVQGNHRRIDPYAASPTVLSTLASDDDATIAEFVRRRDEAEPDDLPPLPDLDRRFVRRGDDDVYIVASEASTGGVAARLEATIRISRRGPQDILVLAWDAAPGREQRR